MRWRLRGADAIYVWLAEREGVPFCTLDEEIDRRVRDACSVIGP
jgi:predicted nucleic acid-binding protein